MIGTAATQHRPSRTQLQRASRASANGQLEGTSLSDSKVCVDERQMGSLPSNALVVIVGAQEVINYLDSLEDRPDRTLVYVQYDKRGEPETFEGYLISEDVSRALCQEFYQGLCASKEKWNGPLILARATKGRFVRALHRTELPVEVPMTG